MMPFKMSDKSLFAILLRSPWWASALVTVAIVAISFAILPPKYVIFGLAVALPFPVIAGIAGWRQWQAPSSGRVEAVRDHAASLSWKEFSRLLESGWAAQGFTVERLKNQAADFELTQGWRKTVVSARRWKTAQVGAEPLRALLDVRESREAQGAMIITLGEVSAPARKLATQRSIELVGVAELARLLPDPRRGG